MADFKKTDIKNKAFESAGEFSANMLNEQGEISLIAKIYNDLLSLTVYKNLQNAPIVGGFLNLLKAANCLIFSKNDPVDIFSKKENFFKSWGNLCITLVNYNFMYNISAGIGKEVLEDVNVFSKTSARLEIKNNSNFIQTEKRLKDVPFFDSAALDSLTLRDLETLERLAKLTSSEVITSVLSSDVFCREELVGLPTWACGAGYRDSKITLKTAFSESLNSLKMFHAKNGLGEFIENKAFFWRENKLTTVSHPDEVTLDDLKEYSFQKQAVVSNTEAFLSGQEANNILLYGDRGTGKSSTVKAILNAYACQKLRLIEVPKSGLYTLPILTEQIADLPLKFIIFVDDLSFAEDDEDFSTLKAVLEGGVSSLPKNVLIYATSNRRHLIKESFSSRQGDEVHRADTIQETVSLSDRFGIVLTYFLPAKREFLEIVEQMADDEGIKLDRELLLKKAESWAINRGARSPRYAKQFIIDLKAKQAKESD